MKKEDEVQSNPLMSAEAIYKMGKIAKTHRAKGAVETEEERKQRQDILKFCLAKIFQFPQCSVLKLEEVALWLEKAYKENPEKTFWHVVRANGFGGSDMGVLYAATEGDQGQSPFQTNRDIIKSKLFLSPIGEDNIHTSRGTRMEPYVKDIFLKDLATGTIVEDSLSNEEKSNQRNNEKTNPLFGAKSILTPEMEASFVSFYDPKHVWLNGNPDEIIQKADGSIVIVDYKAPVDSHGDIPDYYYAQIHHYALIFKKKFPELADKVTTLGLANFNYREGAQVIYKEVPFDQEVADKVLAVGDFYWDNYVMKGKLPKNIEFGNSNELENMKIRVVSRDEEGVTTASNVLDFSTDIENGLITPDLTKYVGEDGLKLNIENVVENIELMLARYSTIRNMSREGDRMSEDVSFAIKHLLLNKLSFEDETDTIKTPTANIALIKRYDMEKLLPELQKYWKKLNLSDEYLNTEIFSNPRAYLSNNFDPSKLFDVTQNYMNDMAFYFNYKNAAPEDKNPEDDLRFNELDVKFSSDLKLRKGAKNIKMENIPEFLDALDTQQRDLDIDYLIRFTNTVDPSKSFPFREFIDYHASDVTIRLRNPVSEKDLGVVTEFKAVLSEVINEHVEKVGLSFANERREANMVDAREAKEKAELEAERKRQEKEEARAKKEAEKLAKAQEAKVVETLDEKAKSELDSEVNDLLGEPKKRKRVVKKNSV